MPKDLSELKLTERHKDVRLANGTWSNNTVTWILLHTYMVKVYHCTFFFPAKLCLCYLNNNCPGTCGNTLVFVGILSCSSLISSLIGSIGSTGAWYNNSKEAAQLQQEWVPSFRPTAPNFLSRGIHWGWSLISLSYTFCANTTKFASPFLLVHIIVTTWPRTKGCPFPCISLGACFVSILLELPSSLNGYPSFQDGWTVTPRAHI